MEMVELWKKSRTVKIDVRKKEFKKTKHYFHDRNIQQTKNRKEFLQKF